jgi:hypothetical protein
VLEHPFHVGEPNQRLFERIASESEVQKVAASYREAPGGKQNESHDDLALGSLRSRRRHMPNHRLRASGTFIYFF